MSWKTALTVAACAAVMAGAASAQTPAPPKKEVPETLIEMFKVAPGRHEEFLRSVALFDEANRRVGLPPRDLYVHDNGAGWDFIVIQPAKLPPGKSEELSKVLKEMGAPSGINYFIEFRKNIAHHDDIFMSGPTSAADYLSGLKK